MKMFRIVKNTYKDGSVKFKIEKRIKIEQGTTWVHITERSTIEYAREAVEFMRGLELVSSEVVESDQY